MDTTFIICPILSFLGIATLAILLVIAYTMRSKREQETAWEKLASRTGLTYEPGAFIKRPYLVGEFQNIPMRIDIHFHTTGFKSSLSSFPYTCLRIALQNHHNMSFSIKEKHRMPLFAKAGAPIRDPEVDARFSIRSEPPWLASEFFGYTNLRQSFLSARSFEIQLAGDELCFEEPGIDKDVDYLIWLLHLLCEVATFIENR